MTNGINLEHNLFNFILSNASVNAHKKLNVQEINLDHNLSHFILSNTCRNAISDKKKWPSKVFKKHFILHICCSTFYSKPDNHVWYLWLYILLVLYNCVIIWVCIAKIAVRVLTNSARPEGDCLLIKDSSFLGIRPQV